MIFIKEKLTANILFSGIGCQERGIENSNLFDFEVTNTSEINKEAVVSYAAIHCGLTPELIDTYKDYPSREEMAKQLTEINLGYVPEKNKRYDWYKLAKRKNKDLEKYWLASKLSNNLGDINKIEYLSYADLWTVSFPCQSISVAGKMKGLAPDSGTRSSLLWQNIRLLKRAKEDNTLPKYIMFENVKNLVSKKFINDFNSLLSVLDELGFNSYWKVINAKDCGVPQNRERVFVISIRKDIDKGTYEFPIPFDTSIRLKDILDETVDEKYYLSEDIQKRFQITDESFTKNIIGTTKPDFRTIGQRDLVYQENSIMGTLVSTDYKQPKQIIEQIPMDKSTNNTQYGLEYANCITAREDRGISKRKSEGTAILETNGVSPTIHICNGGNTETKIAVNEPVCLNSKGGRNGIEGLQPSIQDRVYSSENISTAVTTCFMPYYTDKNISHSEWKQKMFDKYIEDSNGETCGVITNQSQTYGYRPPMKGFSKTLRAEANDTGIVDNYRVRKLTPNECWKLMGLTTGDVEKAKAVGISDCQLYKQAGNGIVTNCVELLAEHLYKAQYDNTYKCSDENFI